MPTIKNLGRPETPAERARTHQPPASRPLPGNQKSTAWRLPQNLSEAAWRRAGEELARLERGVLWWIGDWWRFGAGKYGDRKAVTDDPGWRGPAFQTCMNAASVCRAFETSRRREVLSFKHHAEVVALPSAEADALLDWCEET